MSVVGFDERLRTDELDGWGDLRSGGAVRYEDGLPVEVSDRGGPGADLPIALGEAARVAGFKLQPVGAWAKDSASGAWSVRVAPARPTVVRREDGDFITPAGMKNPAENGSPWRRDQAHVFPCARLAGEWIDAQPDGRWTTEPA